MNTKSLTLFWAISFIAAGIIGFVPNPLVGPGSIFMTNTAHNLVHVVTAIAFFFFLTRSDGAQIKFMIGFGVTYFLVGILGFITLGSSPEGMLLGFIHINTMDNYLHIGLGLGIFCSGLFLNSKSRVQVKDYKNP